MKKIGRIFLLLCIVLALPASVFARDIEIYAQISPSSNIYLGDSFVLQIVLDGVSSPGNVDLLAIEEWSPLTLRGQDASQKLIRIENGRKTVTENKRYIMNYQLTAFAKGQYDILPLSVIVDGRVYKTNPVEINVIEPGETDAMEVRLKLSETTCYPGQPVTLTIDWYIFTNIKNYNISFPTFSSDQFYFEDNPAFLQQLQEKSVINISGIDVPAYEKQGLLKGRQGALVRMQKVIIPKTHGEYDLGPIIVNADMEVQDNSSRSRSRRDPFEDFFSSRKQYKRFMKKSGSVKLNVIPLPTEGRPENFYGLIGKYTIETSAKLSTDSFENGRIKVSVGEPITFKVKIGPSDFLSSVKYPDLLSIPEFAGNFKIPAQHADPEIEGNYKVFTQTIRADNDSVTEIPSVDLAYFDIETKSYQIARSRPIPIEVTAAAKLTADDFVGGAGSTSVTRKLKRIEQGINANYLDYDSLEDGFFNPAIAITQINYMLWWSIPLIAVFLSLVYKFLTISNPQKQLAKKKAYALLRARKAIKEVSGSDYDKLAEAMRSFIGDRFDKHALSLTSHDCYAIIYGNTGSANLAEDFKDILQQCESARYAPVKLELNINQLDSSIQLIKEIDKKAK